MDERVCRVAALANVSSYDEEATRQYVDGAPHIKHSALRMLYGQLVVRVYDRAREFTRNPNVLDLGAGEGSVTLPFLELGAKVIAIDISPSQIDALKKKCAPYGEMLDARCEDINQALSDKSRKFDIVVINSSLHHFPDYLGVIREASSLLHIHGQFFSFQDPLRYDTANKFNRLFSEVAYLSWRIFKGDVIGGMGRRLRRARGIYLEDSVKDNAEYHVTRNGVDQHGIVALLQEQQFDCEIVTYFSTQSAALQALGAALGVKNTFAVIAQKRHGRETSEHQGS